MDTHATARRQAQRFLADHVRNDWDWPHSSSLEPSELHEVIEWRERSYAAESSEPDTDVEKPPQKNPYKFDNPDSVAVTLENKKAERRRKRKRNELEEMSWNEGLHCFVRRRDAWTGVGAVLKLRAPPQSDQPADKATSSQDATTKNDESSEVHTPTSPVEQVDTPFYTPPVTSENASPDDDILVPVAAPLLPSNNPLRAAITPRSYNEIYNKVVLGSRTPSVPVNLSDMTRALVQGWRDNGEWPPRQGPLDPLIGRRKGNGKAIRGISGVGQHSDSSFLAHHPHVKRGVESVKKVFRLSGSHTSGQAG